MLGSGSHLAITRRVEGSANVPAGDGGAGKMARGVVRRRAADEALRTLWVQQGVVSYSTPLDTVDHQVDHRTRHGVVPHGARV